MGILKDIKSILGVKDKGPTGNILDPPQARALEKGAKVLSKRSGAVKRARRYGGV